MAISMSKWIAAVIFYLSFRKLLPFVVAFIFATLNCLLLPPSGSFEDKSHSLTHNQLVERLTVSPFGLLKKNIFHTAKKGQETTCERKKFSKETRDF